MTDRPNLHVVLGATGGAGHAIAGALHDAGLDVRAVSRRGDAALPAAVATMAADIEDDADLRRAVSGAAVVYMAAQPAYHRWPELFPPMLDEVIAAAADEDAKLVMVDNLYAYGPGRQPLTEDRQLRATDAKGRTRAEMAEALLAAHRAGRVRVAIGRASDYFGPGVANSGITALAIAPALSAKGALRWMGSLDVPHSVAYMPDAARAYVTLGTDERADGEVWHLPHGDAVTGREFLAAVNLQLAAPRKLAVVGKGMLRIAAPFHRISKESLGILYQWNEPFIVDSTKYDKVFGPFTVTPLDEAIASTLAAGG